MKVKDQNSKVKTSKTPNTMEELLKVVGEVKAYKRGDVVTGKVTAITGKAVYVDVGGKAEGIVAEREYEAARDYLKTLKMGDEVTALVTSPENDAGQIILSLKRAAADSRWKVFEEALASGETVTVKGREMTKGGLLVDADGVFGFVPASQLSEEAGGDIAALVGKTIEAKVVEVDRDQNRLVLSERAVTDAGQIEERKKALSLVDLGGVYEGKVMGIVPFGAFVEISISDKKQKEQVRLEGLVHISEISWEKIEDVNKAFKEGDALKVKVIGVDEDSGKLALSAKQLTDDPWKQMAAGYKTDSKHKGRVVKVMPYGVIVNLDKGIEGLIHASKMPGDTAFAEGQEVEVFVESVDVDKRRLSLGVVLTEKPVDYK